MGREGHCKQISLVCVGSAHSVWTTLGLPQLKAVCASWVYTAQAPGCSAGYCPKRALHFVDFPGLSCSGSGSRVFCKGTHSGGHAFCALPGSEPLRQPGVWQAHCPMWAMRFNHLPSLAAQFPWVRCENTVSGVSCVSSRELIQAAAFLADVNRPGSQEDVVSNWEPAHSLVEDAGPGVEIAAAPCLLSGCCPPASLPPAAGGPCVQPASSPLVFQSFVL